MMAVLSNIREWFARRIYWLAPVIAIAVLFAADLVYFANSIAPTLQTQAELSSQLADAQAALAQTPAASNDAASLQRRVVEGQATVTALNGLLLDSSQRSEIVNALYQNAQLSGVKITQLTDLSAGATVTPTLPAKTPTPLPPPPTATPVPPTTLPGLAPTVAQTPAAPAPLPPTPRPVAPVATPVVKSSYTVTPLRLQVQGDPRRLMNFLARFRDLSTQGFTIDNVNLTGNSTTALLTIDLSLYFSAVAKPTGTPVK